MGVLFSWWLAIELLGIVGLPLTATLFANLPDRGWALSKPLSLLLLGWLIWFPLSLIPALPFNRGWILVTALLFALGNAALLRRRETLAALRRLLTRHWGYVALTEGLFAGAFALMAWVRSFTPAVVDTEKFMDVAFLSAIWRAPHLPPPDPWLSGQPINYYYFGHYLMALPAKTLGTQPAVAFNVAVALTFALAATAIFGVATNIAAVARSRLPADLRSADFQAGRRATSRATDVANGEMGGAGWGSPTPSPSPAAAGEGGFAFPAGTRGEEREAGGVANGGEESGAGRGTATGLENGAGRGTANGLEAGATAELPPLLPPRSRREREAPLSRRSGGGAGGGGTLLPPAIAGLLAVILTLIVGNLNGAQVWYHIASGLSGRGMPLHGNVWGWWTQRALWPQYDWWAPSRVIPNTINEFPAFSFALADLHAHVLALPFAALAIGLAFNLLLASGEGIGVFGRRGVGWLCLAVSGVILGSLYAINGWDLPTYVGLAVLALLIQQWLAHERVIDSVLLIDLATVIAMLVALGLIFYFPFYRGFSSPGLGVGIVPATQHTPIGDEIAIFGLPLFLALSLLALRLARLAPRPSFLEGRANTMNGPLVIGGVGVALLAFVTWRTMGSGLWTLFWGLLIIGACAWLALRKLDFRLAWGAVDDADTADVDDEPDAVGGVNAHAQTTDLEDNASQGDGADGATGVSSSTPLRWSERAELWVYVLIGTATALVVTCELVYLRDIFGGTPSALGVDFRMNTVFKLYYQAWLIFGVASGPLVAWLTVSAWRSLAAMIPAVVAVRWLGAGESAEGEDIGAPQGALAYHGLASRRLATVLLAMRRGWAALREAAARPISARLAVAGTYRGVLSGRVALAARASSRSRSARRSAKSSHGGKGASRGAEASGEKPTMQSRQGKATRDAAPVLQPGATTQHGGKLGDVSAGPVGRPVGSGPAGNGPAGAEPANEFAPGGLAATTFADADADADAQRVERRLLRRGTGDGRPEANEWAQAAVGAVWLVVLVALVAVALIYPVMAVAARSDNLTQPHSLDGTAYMAYDSENSGDQYAIAWLNTHVSGDPVIVEAATYNEYTHLGRVSAFTGLPTLMGWGGHEEQWRYNWFLQAGRGNTISQRLDAVSQIYSNPSDSQVLALLHEYNVRFVYVGAGERVTYPNANLTRFSSFLRVVYQYDGVAIYAVP